MQALREQLAEFAHNEQWSGWMRYFFSKCDEVYEDGSIYVPRGYVEALRRQMSTPYSELSEDEKDSDRAEADRMLALFGESLQYAFDLAESETARRFNQKTCSMPNKNKQHECPICYFRQRVKDYLYDK